MEELFNSRYLKEKGFLGPFSLSEAFCMLILCAVVFTISSFLEDKIGHSRLWTLSWTGLVLIVSFLGKVLIKHRNPTWLSSIISYYLLQRKRDRFHPIFKKYPLCKDIDNKKES